MNKRNQTQDQETIEKLTAEEIELEKLPSSSGSKSCEQVG